MQKRVYASLILSALCFQGCAPTVNSPVAKDENAATTEFAQESSLQEKLDSTIRRFRDDRLLDSEVNAAWQIMHAVICYGDELKLQTPDKGVVSGLEYLFSNGMVEGFELFPGDDNLATTGRPGMRARFEPGSYIGQGHVDQWIAICAMADIPADRVILVGDQEFTIEDWVRQAQADIPKNVLNEFSWTLIALTHYLPNEPTWQSRVVAEDGSFEEYSVSWEMLVEEELRTGLDESACGGTHKLAGIVRALAAKREAGLGETRVWRDAQQRIDELIATAKEFRSSNGQLSSHYFWRPGATADLIAQLSSSGHTFEFLALALSDGEIAEPWVELAAHRLCDTLELIEPQKLDCGALYHALNGIRIYRQRRFGS